MKTPLFLFFFVCSFGLYASQQQIEKLYQDRNVVGSLIIESIDGKHKYHYNVDNEKSYIPASTFKIPNTLIILEEDLISSLSELIKWDGVTREVDSWNRDHTLQSAFQYSCVWCYQRYAKKIGNEQYKRYLKRLDYGNQLTGDDVTRFWLDGDLRISVQEQINFLRKLQSSDLPIQKKHLDTLKEIMLSKESNGLQIWSKTGWSGINGWFVGYLVADQQTWFFANHIEIQDPSKLPLRKALVMEAFRVLNIIQ